MPEDNYAKDLRDDVLKGIHAKCTAKYPGKYPSGLLDINVTLDENEITEIRKEIGAAKKAISNFKRNNPEYEKLRDYLGEMRRTLGHLDEMSRVIEDPSATKVTKTLIDDKIPGLKVPTAIYRVYVWENKIRELEEDLTSYEKGLSKGQAASYLGTHVRDIYTFLKKTPKKS